MPLSSFLILLLLSSASASSDFEFKIRENSEVGTPVGSLLKKPDGNPSGVTLSKLSTVSHVSQAYCAGKFSVEKTTGYIMVSDRVDREEMCGSLPVCLCNLRLILKDDSIVTIDIQVVDENDHAPAFAVPIKAITISESAPVGYEHNLDLAVDPDLPPNGVSQYYIHDASDTFAVIDNKEDHLLKLVLKRRLDHETNPRYNATLGACDAGTQRRCGTQRLIISVKDENDNAPVFEKEKYVVDVPENTTMGTRVAQLRATDADARENGRVTYSLRASQKETVGRWFHVDETTGDVYLNKKLKFREKEKYDILVDAMDHGSSPRKKTVTLVINVKDLNDNAPYIRIRILTGERIQVTENTVDKGPLAHIVVVDNDDPKSPGGKFDCFLSKGDDYFKLTKIMDLDGPTSIYAFQPIRAFDRESITVYTAHVNCQDHGTPPLSSKKEVSVYIIDKNEHKPVFTSRNFTKSISENRHVGERVLGVSARDQDADAKLRYSLDTDGQQYFRIDSLRGDIYTVTHLDREVVSVINFGVQVTDADADSDTVNTASSNVQILILDSNDNPPTVVGQRRFSVEENLGEYHLGNLQANDPDVGENGEVVFKLLGIRKSKNHPLLRSKIFELTPDGSLSVMATLDRESVSQYLLEVLVHDLGNPQLNASSTITVDVLDQNDNNPVWTHPAVKGAMKNTTDLIKPGDVITRVHARDDDVIRNITYHLLEDAQGRFQVELVSGKLRAASLVKPGVYPLVLRASDNGEPPRTTQISYTINVLHHSTAAAAGSQSPMNFTLVVGMIAATCVISISLLVAIFVVRRRTLRTRRPKGELAGYTQDESLYPTNGTVYPISGQNFYHGVPMSSFGAQEKVNGHTTIRPLPTDMEVASADSGHGASEEENGQAALNTGLSSDLKIVRSDYRPHIGNSRAFPILPEDSVIQCGCGDTIDLAGNTLHSRCQTGASAPPSYNFATSSTFRTFPRQPRAPLQDGSGSIDGSLSRLCHSPQTNV